jgi:uncharacterized phage protein (TIGR02218 family)
MRTLPGALGTHVAGEALTLAWGLRITRDDGQVFAYTSHDVEVEISAVTYDPSQGLMVSALSLSAGLSVDNLELSTLDDGTLFTRFGVLSGVWKNASFVLFQYNWASPGDGIDTRMSGTLGELRLLRGRVVVELRGLQQYLQQPIANVSTKLCRWRLGDARCRKVLTSFTYTGTVTAAADRQTFTVGAYSGVHAADWFADGELEWTAGANAGVRAKVKSNTGAGVITLTLPAIGTVQAGDTISIVAGCRKRLTEDCSTKFGNVVNFGGEPHRPKLDDLTKTARPEL